jgi:hypothetical protein
MMKSHPSTGRITLKDMLPVAADCPKCEQCFVSDIPNIKRLAECEPGNFES